MTTMTAAAPTKAAITLRIVAELERVTGREVKLRYAPDAPNLVLMTWDASTGESIALLDETTGVLSYARIEKHKSYDKQSFLSIYASESQRDQLLATARVSVAVRKR